MKLDGVCKLEKEAKTEGRPKGILGPQIPCPGISFGGDAGRTCLFVQQHMTASILLIARFVLIGTEWTILAVGYDRDLLRIHT